MVITDGSNLFPLCGLEHQMVNVAGVALHHLGNGGEKQHVNKKGINTPPTVYGYAKQLNVSAALKKKGSDVRPQESGLRPMCSRCCPTLTSCLSWRSEVSRRSFLSAAAVQNL